MLAPEEIHDGDAVDGAGFTYRMLYLPVPLLRQTLPALFADAPDRFELVFPHTLVDDPLLAGAQPGRRSTRCMITRRAWCVIISYSPCLRG